MSIKKYFLDHNTMSFIDFTSLSIGSYEVFLINNQINHKSLYKSPTNFIVPLCPLISPLHNYHITMTIYTSKCTWGFLRKTFKDPIINKN